MMRQCGDCQLCCRLLPLPPLNKGAGERCQYQKFHKGCTVYHTAEMPMECGLWNCRWLVNDDTADLARPDRSHYVIDIMPDYVTAVNNVTGKKDHVQVVQIWIDPQHRDAHRDPALRAYLLRRGAEGVAAIIRYNAKEGFALFPPQINAAGEWAEIHDAVSFGRERTATEVVQALGPMTFNITGEGTNG